MVLNKQLIFYFHMMGNFLVSLLSTWFVRFAKFDMRQNIFCTLYNYVNLNCLNYRHLFRVFRPTREVFKHIDMSSLRVKCCKYLCSALITIVHKWFLACHIYSDTVYHCYFRGPTRDTYTCRREHLTAELSLPALTIIGKEWNF